MVAVPGIARRHVVIVEDHADSAAALAALLKHQGHHVRVVADGERALQAATEHQPDVVLCDIGLPGMDGCEVARRLRQLPGLKDTLLVAMTGRDAEVDRLRAKGAGFDRFLVKPVEPAYLLDLVAGL